LTTNGVERRHGKLRANDGSVIAVSHFVIEGPHNSVIVVCRN
jgi:hypothetical protein